MTDTMIFPLWSKLDELGACTGARRSLLKLFGLIEPAFVLDLTLYRLPDGTVGIEGIDLDEIARSASTVDLRNADAIWLAEHLDFDTDEIGLDKIWEEALEWDVAPIVYRVSWPAEVRCLVRAILDRELGPQTRVEPA